MFSSESHYHSEMSEIICWTELFFIKNSWKLWHVFVRSSASGEEDEVPTNGKPKQTNFLSNFQEFLYGEELCSASYFRYFTLINVIQNRTMKNFCQKSFLWNFLVIYVNVLYTCCNFNSSLNQIPVNCIIQPSQRKNRYQSSNQIVEDILVNDHIVLV